MDISRSISDFLPKKSSSVQAGLWLSLALLTLAITVGILGGFAGYWLLQLVVPDAPVYTSLVFGIVTLVLALIFIAQRFEWIMPWYYLLPAILFLLTFTFFPVILTVVLAFTDYAGVRNGQLNVSSTSNIANVEGDTLTLENPRAFNCGALRNGCSDVRAIVYASGSLEVAGSSLEGETLSLESEIPEDREVRTATFSVQGFPLEVTVSSAEGDTLTLQDIPPILANASPDAVDLSSVRLALDRTGITRMMTGNDENSVTLAEPLPEGLAPESIARFNDFGYVGWSNFRTILRRASSTLLPVFTWNVAFATLTMIINIAVGVFLAVLLNNPELRFRNLYRTLLIIPWALPQIITIQVWKGFLNTNFGAINRSLALLDLPTFNWLDDPYGAKAAILLVNLWLGFPFMMTATLGALSAIPGDLYEAAKIDGANAWRRFTGVTAPLLRTALVPIALTGFAFNFNNFNIIYLLTDGGPFVEGYTSTARSTDILITWAYNEAFRAQGGYAYGLGSAISLLIFFITIAVSLVNFRVTGALDEETNA